MRRLTDVDAKQHAVAGYLSGCFPDHEISPVASAEPLAFEIRHGLLTYTLEFDPDFIREHSAAEIRRLLEHWDAAEELRRAEGMRLVVTNRGVRLDSSN